MTSSNMNMIYVQLTLLLKCFFSKQQPLFKETNRRNPQRKINLKQQKVNENDKHKERMKMTSTGKCV